MKNSITIKDNPARQEKNRRIKEISFFDGEGSYKGLLMSFTFCNNKPTLNLYCIDKEITINVSKRMED